MEDRISWQAGEIIRRGLLGDVFCCLDEQCGRIMAVEKVCVLLSMSGAVQRDES